MSARVLRRGFTLVELLVVIAVIAIVPWRYVLRHYVLGAGQ